MSALSSILRATEVPVAPEPIDVASPDTPAGLEGSTTATHKNATITISNGPGYHCQINCEAVFSVAPNVIFDIFTHENNAGAFRDIKDIGYRKLLAKKCGWQKLEVEQIGELKVLWMRKQFSTFLTVTEDCRDPSCLTTSFELLKSDTLSRFSGSWELRPLLDPSTKKVIGTKGILRQSILPKAMLNLVRGIPGMGSMVRKEGIASMVRQLEDIDNIIQKTHTGLTVDEAMQTIARERGYKPSKKRPQKVVGMRDVAANSEDGSLDSDVGSEASTRSDELNNQGCNTL